MEQEIWKDIPGYEGKYQASNLGNIRSLNYNRLGIIKNINKRNHTKGYLQSNLFRKTYLIHRLVALTFIPNPEKLETINHKNGIKTDNRVENLEWCTKSENLILGHKMGLFPYGEKHHNFGKKFKKNFKNSMCSLFN